MRPLREVPQNRLHSCLRLSFKLALSDLLSKNVVSLGNKQYITGIAYFYCTLSYVQIVVDGSKILKNLHHCQGVRITHYPQTYSPWLRDLQDQNQSNS